jgi:uncharacterized protein with HEPN domain
LDILGALANIENMLQKEKRHLRRGTYPIWIIHYIQIAGEAANQLSDSIKKNHLEIPWKGITGMRNVLVHQYFGLDLDEIWDTVTTDLPVLKVKIQELLEETK